FLAAVALSRGFAAVASDEIGIQGRWAYSRQAGPDGAIDMATTPALQDPDVWFLLACNANGRLSVALMHADRFSFELDGSSSLHVQSATVQHHRHGGTLAAGADRDRSAARASCHAAARRGAGALG